MGFEAIWRVCSSGPALKGALGLAVVLLGGAVSACTTAEGTNALVDPATFEREVMTSTLQGLDLVPQDEKPPPGVKRGPLVMPKQTAYLPPPSRQDVAALPPDSDSVQISTTGLTDADIKRLRNARVVDLRTISGRPLTTQEQRQLTARLRMAHVDVSTRTSRDLTVPPPSYFTNVGGKDTVCRAADGELVSLRDPKCPEKIRKAFRVAPQGGGSLFNQQDATLNELRNGTYQGPGSH